MENLIEKSFNMWILFDCYGNLLTERQREIFHYYYDEDLSLSEIALNCGISRQCVYDTIKNVKVHLNNIEKNVGLLKKINNLGILFKDLQEKFSEIAIENLNIKCSEKIDRLLLESHSLIKNFIQEECKGAIR